MEGHSFSPILKDAISGEEYRTCNRCRQVMFVRGDDWFNMYCQPVIQDREDIRKRLRG